MLKRKRPKMLRKRRSIDPGIQAEDESSRSDGLYFKLQQPRRLTFQSHSRCHFSYGSEATRLKLLTLPLLCWLFPAVLMSFAPPCDGGKT